MLSLILFLSPLSLLLFLLCPSVALCTVLSAQFLSSLARVDWHHWIPAGSSGFCVLFSSVCRNLNKRTGCRHVPNTK